MYKYYQLGNVVYFSDEATKVTDGSVEISKAEFDQWHENNKPPRTWTPRQFLRLFSDEKRLQITQLSMANAQVKMWYDDLLASQEVVEGNADLMAGLDALVQTGVLEQQDIDNALA